MGPTAGAGSPGSLFEIGKAKLGGDHKSEKYKSSLSKNDKVDPPHNVYRRYTVLVLSLGI